VGGDFGDRGSASAQRQMAGAHAGRGSGERGFFWAPGPDDFGGEVRSAPAGVDPSQRAGGGSPLGRISSASSRWPARLGNDVARLATTDLDVRRISNDEIKRKKMWVMTRHECRAPSRQPSPAGYTFSGTTNGWR